MKFLHTSDWHVGRTIRGRSRADEFAAVLHEVVKIAADEKVDAVLVSGDLYDHKVPQPESERLVLEGLVRLHESGARVIAITGNHDSAAKWDALRPLLRPLGITVVTGVARPDEGGAVEVPSRDGTATAVVACLPFVAERWFGEAARLFAASENWAMDYASGMGELLGEMAKAFRPDAVNILLAHLYATDVDLGGGESAHTVTLDYAVPPARFPGTATYVALGHVHKPQAVAASPSPARYAGSLLQLDFGEREQRKSVAIVEADPGRPARIRLEPLAAGRRLVDVTGTLEELRAQAASVGDAWLRVKVKVEAPVPGIVDAVREALPNAIEVQPDYPRAEEEPAPAGMMALAPGDQFAAYYRKKHAADPPPEVVAAFAEVLEAVAR